MSTQPTARRIGSAVLLFFLTSFGPSTWAAPPILPPEAIGDDVVLVTWFDATQVTDANLREALIVTGGILIRDVSRILEMMKYVESQRERFVKDDGASLALLMTAESPAAGVFSSAKNQRLDLLIFKHGVDPARMRSWRKEFRGTPMGDRTLALDLFLWGDSAAWPKASKARHDAFEKLLVDSGSPAAAALVLPNEWLRRQVKGGADEWRAQMERDPAADPLHKNFQLAMADLAERMAEAKQLTLTVRLGNAPVVALTIEAASEDATRALALQVKSAGGAVARIQERKPAQGPPARTLEKDAQVVALFGWLPAIEPKAEGNRISLRLETNELRTLFARLMFATGELGPKDEENTLAVNEIIQGIETAGGLLHKGQIAGATAILNGLAAKYPDHAGITVVKLMLAVIVNENAAKEIAKGIATASELRRKGQDAEADATLKALVAKYPNHADLKVVRSMLADTEVPRGIETAGQLLRKGKKAEGIAILKDLVATYPNHPDIKKAKTMLAAWDKK